MTDAAPTLIGRPLPEFALEAIDAAGTVRTVRPGDFAGRWLLLVFYPRDFSFVCPTELTAFSARVDDFAGRDCDLLGISVDDLDTHRRWLATPPGEGGVGPLRFPLASDASGTLARAMRVYDEKAGVSLRGLFVADPGGAVQYAVVHNLSVGRNPAETLRTLDGLRSGGLCPVNWTAADGTLDLAAALQPGRVLGSYRLDRQAGQGATGMVFQAWDMTLRRPVAVKVLKAARGQARETLLREARAAAALVHPNIRAIYAVEEEGGLPLIAMEYLDGTPLDERVGRLSAGDVRPIAAGVAEGLAHAHGQGVSHGDLKPANVFVTEAGVAKLLDFGLAQGDDTNTAGLSDGVEIDDLAETLSASAAAGGAALGFSGTPAYMAPEQADGHPGGAAGDAFSFALVLYELLTGFRALQADTLPELLELLRRGDLPERLAPQAPAAYRELLAELWSPDPDRRPPMRQVADRLR